eukprot:CAMPEP_0184493242 /NCGR_PEP_ID=MMETSP0113_2-20130426/25495_1 /TAXON_ID=91329 /ORGANISM="Norrisiella sphaerica, Strain BC52" /LENGTH=468 /DNA_ID=CAMNT_0026878443 /DNA_START=194 /DNA_END=1600 /DNA_ORIENTATION=+
MTSPRDVKVLHRSVTPLSGLKVVECPSDVNPLEELNREKSYGESKLMSRTPRDELDRSESKDRKVSGSMRSPIKPSYSLRVSKRHQRHPSRLTKEVVKVAAGIFRKFDRDQSGTLSREEFAKALMKISDDSSLRKDPKKAQEKADRIIRRIHKEGLSNYSSSTAEVSFNEFLNAVVMSKANKFDDIKQIVEKATWYYGTASAIASFYRPQEKESYSKKYKCWPPPLIIPLMSVLILGVFIYYVEADNKCAGERLADGAIHCPEVYESLWAYHYDSAYKNEWWRFITYMALHAGVAHLIANLFLQIIVGIPLEMVHGPWRPFLLYILGGLAGSLCVSMFDEYTNIVGASAGCYALVGAHVANIINYWSIMPYAMVRLVLFLLIFFIDIGISAYRKYALDERSVSYTSHLGGAAMGLIMGSIVLDGIRKEENRTVWKKLRVYGGLAVGIIFLLIGAAYNIWFPQKTREED